MARPKKQKADNSDDTTMKAVPGAEEGKNALTDDERQTLALNWLRQYEATLATKNKASSEHSNLCKRMKGEIGDDAVDQMKDLIAARTDEGSDALRRKIERAMWAAKCMAAPLGSQLELLDTADRTPAVDRATAEGVRDGKLGVPMKPDYAPDTAQYRAYAEAYATGQKAIFNIQRAQDAALFNEVKGKPSLQAQFDDDAPIGDQPGTFETMA